MHAQYNSSLRKMKKDLILSSGFVIALVAMISVAVFLPVGAATITGSAKFDPNRIDLNLPAPSMVEAKIRFESSQHANPRDIDASTILLEGSLPPDTTYQAPGTLVAEFDGEIVVALLWARIYHIGVLTPPYKIWLTITGNLNEAAGGTPFSAEGYIRIVVHHSPPPP